MEIKSRKVKRVLKRLARLSVVSTYITKVAGQARKAALEALDEAGIVIPTGEGESVDVPLRNAGSIRITAVKPSDTVSLDVPGLIERFKDEDRGITIEQLVNCVAGWDVGAIDAVFGKGLVTTKPGEGDPTIRFTPSKEDAVLAAADRFMTRVAGKPEAKPVDKPQKVAAAA